VRVEPFREIKDYVRVLHAMKHEQLVREILLIQVMFNTNLRISDALLLRWDDVLEGDKKLKTIRREFTVSELKTAKKKWIPVTDQLNKSLLNVYYKYRPRGSDFIFRSRSPRIQRRNQPWRQEHIYKLIKRFTRELKIRGNFGTHSMRKTWGYHAYMNGTDIYEIMRVMNHNDVRTTEIYCGIDADRIRKTHQKVSKLAEASDDILDIDTLPEMKKLKPMKRTAKKKRRPLSYYFNNKNVR
jgi:integrase